MCNDVRVVLMELIVSMDDEQLASALNTCEGARLETVISDLTSGGCPASANRLKKLLLERSKNRRR